MKKKQAEPILIKAGDAALKIGCEPPRVDCRVVAEDYYQRMIKKIEQRDESLELLKIIENNFSNHSTMYPDGFTHNQIKSLIEKTENQ